MINANLIRLKTTKQGTPGILTLPGFTCRTIELPWKDNQAQLSCIPAGTYMLEPWNSAKFGKVYHVLDVPDRAAVLLHAGNWAGSSPDGYLTNSHGCILLGGGFGILKGQLAIVKSKPTVNALRRLIGAQNWQLTIVDGYEGVQI